MMSVVRKESFRLPNCASRRVTKKGMVGVNPGVAAGVKGSMTRDANLVRRSEGETRGEKANHNQVPTTIDNDATV